MFLQAVKNLFTSPAFQPEAPSPAPPPVDRRNREYFRIDTRIDLSYILEQEFAPDRPLQTHSVNLSAGGLRLRLAELPAMHSLVWLKLALPGQTPLECLGKVVWHGGSSSSGWEVAMQFVDLAPAQRDVIIAFCFAEQRRLLRHYVRVA
jgi:c-di-GMP-binding flagellar brake protein YcgR